MPLIARLGRIAVACAAGDAGRYAATLICEHMKTQEDLETEEFLKALGFAVFCAQGLEYTMVNLFAASKKLSQGLKVTVRELMDARYKNTLGMLINNAATSLKLSDELRNELQLALTERNWLTHHFFREYGAIGISSELRKKAIERITAARIAIEQAWESVHQEAIKRMKDAGLSEQQVHDNIENALDEYLADVNVKRDSA